MLSDIPTFDTTFFFVPDYPKILQIIMLDHNPHSNYRTM